MLFQFSSSTALWCATNNSDVDMVALLLSRGASADRGYFESNSFQSSNPLHSAVVAENKEIINLLLQYGANPNAVDRVSNVHIHDLFSILERCCWRDL